MYATKIYTPPPKSMFTVSNQTNVYCILNNWCICIHISCGLCQPWNKQLAEVTVSVNKTLLLHEPLPCNPAAETALQPLISCSESSSSDVYSSPEECFFHRHWYCLGGTTCLTLLVQCGLICSMRCLQCQGSPGSGKLFVTFQEKRR